MNTKFYSFFLLFIVCLSLVFLYSIRAQAETITVYLSSGNLRVHNKDYRSWLSFEGRNWEVDSAYIPNIIAQKFDSVLLELYSGGTACPAEFVWISIRDGKLESSTKFGTCADLPNIDYTTEYPTVILSSFDGTEFAFKFDGQIVNKEYIGLRKIGVGDPKVAKNFEGRFAFEVLTSAEMEPFLLEILSYQQLKELISSSTLSSDKMSRDGEWFAATGCQPHFCSSSFGGVAISTKDGRIIAARWTEEGGGLLFGQPNSAIPNKLRSVLDGELPF